MIMPPRHAGRRRWIRPPVADASASSLPPAATLLALLAVAGCGDSTAIRPADVRVYTAAKQAVRTDLSTPRDAARQESGGAARLAIRYESPPGWTDRGGSGMRLATLLIGDAGAGHEVTVIRAAGSLESNVARWLGQLDPDAAPDTLAEQAAAALSAAETLPVGSAEATLVQLVDESAPEGILAGVIPLDDDSSLFVKFKGPTVVARSELEHFKQFLASIRWD
jgi:hypothetical protein